MQLFPVRRHHRSPTCTEQTNPISKTPTERGIQPQTCRQTEGYGVPGRSVPPSASLPSDWSPLSLLFRVSVSTGEKERSRQRSRCTHNEHVEGKINTALTLWTEWQLLNAVFVFSGPCPLLHTGAPLPSLQAGHPEAFAAGKTTPPRDFREALQRDRADR